MTSEEGRTHSDVGEVRQDSRAQHLYGRELHEGLDAKTV